MNRLILIGNGFDLAHGLKTSYHDFILDYLKECFKIALDDLKIRKESRGYRILHSDKLIEIRVLNANNQYYDTHPIITIKEIKDQIIFSDSFHKIKSLADSIGVTINYKGSFPQFLLYETQTKKWVDIEGLYYEELKKYLKLYNRDKDKHGVADTKDLKTLNNQLDFIKEELKKYLTKIQSEGFLRINELDKIIYGSNKQGDIPEKILFLNFNYTFFAEKYATTVNADLINIHGQLSDTNNEIIFGYGDDIDMSFKELKELGEDDFLKHLKSYEYLKNENHENLINFIESREYEVFIMGHSCGLSDRSLLSTIFRNKNCKSIRIFFHQENTEDFTNKSYGISRHIENQLEVLSKVVKQKYSTPMPQAPKQL